MTRRIGSGRVGALLVLVLAAATACGGSDASPTPSGSAEPTGAAPATEAPATTEPTAAPAETPAAGPVRMLARCAGVALRTGPGVEDELVVRVAKLTRVRVVETVPGDSYEAGACGASGSDWIKIDRVNGKSVRKTYDVPFVYAAAGFFE